MFSTVASGTLPDELVPVIQEWNHKGISFFLVAGNYGTDHGILANEGDTLYGTMRRPVAAGAIPIRDVNINHLADVARAVQTAINDGKQAEI